MVAICSRPPLPGHPSLCTIDVAIIPLATYLFFLAQLIHLFTTYRLRRTLPSPPVGHRPFLLPQWAHIGYFVLILAALAMVALEIARLTAAHLGVGLLPVTLVGLLGALVVQGLRAERKVFRAEVLFLYWTLLWIFEAIKVSRLVVLEHHFPDKQIAEYPSSDQLIDNVVLLALYLVFAFVEASEFIYRRRNTKALDREGAGQGGL